MTYKELVCEIITKVQDLDDEVMLEDREEIPAFYTSAHVNKEGTKLIIDNEFY